eukprot:13691114-Ditylum_brightwellii.AAC.1
MPDTVAEVNADTVKCVPHTIPIPSFSNRETIQQAVTDIIAILKNPDQNNIPSDIKGDPVVQAFAQIAMVLN